MRSSILAVFLATSALGVFAQQPPDFSLLGRNLIRNAGAEAESKDKTMPSWGAAQEGFSSPEYGSVGGEWDWGVSGCDDCGKRYFRFSWEAEVPERSASQTIDVSAAARAIDTGKVSAQLSGYFGAFRNSDTTIQIIAECDGASGQTLATIETPAVDAATLPEPTVGDASIILQTIKGAVPAGTRKIEVRLHARKTGESGSHTAMADNLVLVLAAPE